MKKRKLTDDTSNKFLTQRDNMSKILPVKRYARFNITPVFLHYGIHHDYNKHDTVA